MKKSIYTFFLTASVIAYSGINGLTCEGNETIQSTERKRISHASVNSLLTKYVTDEGVVNYKGFKTEHNKLKTYITFLETHSPEVNWSKNEKLAYWINLYNSLTIDLLLDNYPIASITKIEGKDYTLNEIENKIIRPIFNEPRIHFAVNCGAKSCPKLLNEAFTGDKLEAQLQKQTIAFINNSIENQLTTSSAQISKIFEWYAADFGEIVPFLNKYSDIKVKLNAKISYSEYNWQLNGK